MDCGFRVCSVACTVLMFVLVDCVYLFIVFAYYVDGSLVLIVGVHILLCLLCAIRLMCDLYILIWFCLYIL